MWVFGIGRSSDTIDGMSWGTIELESEVRDWLEAIAPGRRIILLTVFAKTKGKEKAEVASASAAMRRCIAANPIVEED